MVSSSGRHKLLVERISHQKPICNCSWQLPCLKLKPETNVALMMSLVFYLYICLGGALFLLLEGQVDLLEQTVRETKELKDKFNISYGQLADVLPLCEKLNGHRMKIRIDDNLWNFLESTDFAYHVVTGQGTGQTTRILKTEGSKIAYIFFALFGVPLALLTFRATGQRLNIFTYALIRFINVKVFCRQLTPNVHLKAMCFNTLLLLSAVMVGAGIHAITQSWSIVESIYFTVNVLFTIGNFDEQIINESLETNSNKDKIFRIVLNFYSFLGFTILSSFLWSSHHFTRHMRFQAQNRLARNGDARSTCPWVEITRSHTASPSTKSTRERETDRESVC